MVKSPDGLPRQKTRAFPIWATVRGTRNPRIWRTERGLPCFHLFYARPCTVNLHLRPLHLSRCQLVTPLPENQPDVPSSLAPELRFRHKIVSNLWFLGHYHLRDLKILFGFGKVAHSLRTLATIQRNGVLFSGPTWQLITISNSSPRGSSTLSWASLGSAHMWCTALQAGKTPIHIQ